MIQLQDKLIGYQNNVFNSSTIKAGLTMTFENGFTISIQFGQGNYCDNKFESKDSCKNVEIAIFDKENKFFRLPQMNQDIEGWVTMDELADFIQQVKNL